MANLRKTDCFLDLYKRLETAAAKVVGKRSRGSMILHLADHPRFARFRSELDCCREVRNLLAHEVKIGGDFAVEPSDASIALLEKILAMIETPSLARSCAIPPERLLTASESDSVFWLTKKMQERGISHVPMLVDGIVRGVFSEHVLFEALQTRRALTITDRTTLAEFSEFLPIEHTIGGRYRFLPATATIDDAALAFECTKNGKDTAKIVFLTEHGNVDERLIGLLSPSNVLEIL